ncbi:chromosome transmission fidelity protein 8 homolog [Athalia rosae]|uniref:chromosome transmission fidelity protein 8 homolog n=1 Tax=Athalia rosae TaxID=37344 RepID=UPI0006262A07|nr:chromosome transmission fidelity protein 8 homolog [Athalia rosae]
MIIRIKKNGFDSNEWAIIELQGELQSRSNQALNDQFIGDLHFKKNGTPILMIGHHILYGKEVNLEKPYAVLQKVFDTDTYKVENSGLPSPPKQVCYIAKAMVTKKLVFRVRPKPIIDGLE